MKRKAALTDLFKEEMQRTRHSEQRLDMKRKAAQAALDLLKEEMQRTGYSEQLLYMKRHATRAAFDKELMHRSDKQLGPICADVLTAYQSLQRLSNFEHEIVSIETSPPEPVFRLRLSHFEHEIVSIETLQSEIKARAHGMWEMAAEMMDMCSIYESIIRGLQNKNMNYEYQLELLIANELKVEQQEHMRYCNMLDLAMANELKDTNTTTTATTTTTTTTTATTTTTTATTTTTTTTTATTTTDTSSDDALWEEMWQTFRTVGTG